MAESIPRDHNSRLSWRQAALLLLGSGMIACFIAIATLDHLTVQGYRFLTILAAAFILYVIAVILFWRCRVERPAMLLTAIFAVALLMRLPLWFTEPTLSTDVWRYLWDGQLLNNGVNPFAERVDSESLDPLATPLRTRIEHQWMASPYPPVAQIVFGGIYALAPESPTAMQIVFTLFDLATGVVTVLLLRRLERPVSRVLLYLWNPLIVVEFAHSAHVDSLMTLLVMLAFYWLIVVHRTKSMIALALATLTKFTPALLLPVFIRRWGVWRTMGYGVLVVVGFLPFMDAGWGLGSTPDGTGVFGALRIYAEQWRTNDGLFYWLVKTLELAVSDPVSAAKLISLVILGGVALWVFWRSGEDNTALIVEHSVWLISVYLLLSAVMFPWYLAWLLAYLPLLETEGAPERVVLIAAWVMFSASINLSYLFYLDPANPHELEWVRRVEYLPLFGMLALSLWLVIRQRFMRLSATSPAGP